MNNAVNRLSKIFCLLLLFFSNLSFAVDSLSHQSTLAIADRQLHIDKESQELVKKQFLDLKTAKIRQFQLLQERGVTPNILKHAQLDLIAAQAAVEGANIALTDAKEAIEDIDVSIRKLEKNLQNLILLSKGNQEREMKIISVEANLEFLKRLQQIQNERIVTLNNIKAVTEQRLKLESTWQQKLQVLYSFQQQDAQRNRLTEILSHLQQQQQAWLLKLSNLTQTLQVLMREEQVSDTNLKKLHLQILEAEENVALIRLKSYLVQVQNRVENLREIHKTQPSSYQLNALLEQSSNILAQLNSAQEFVAAKNRFLTMKKMELATDQRKQILTRQDSYSYSRMLTNLISNYEQENKHITNLERTTSYYQHEYKLQLQHHLSERQKLPADLVGWISLGQRFLQIPYLLANALRNFLNQIVSEVKHHHDSATLLLTLVPILIGCWFYLRRFLLNLEINIQENKQRFSTNIIFIIVELGRRNLGGVLIFILLLALTLSLHFSSPLFVYLLLVYLGFKISLSIAKITLLENTTYTSGNDVKLFYRIRWSLILGFLLSTLTVIMHHMPVAYEAKTLVNRLFMVFILVMGLQLFKARTFVTTVLENIIHLPRYFSHVLKLLSKLIPFALMFNAVIGLLGYVELAWMLATYQFTLILVIAGYLIVRGLLIDAMEFLSELLIRFVKQGWLWTEAILKPLDRVFRVILFLLSSIFLLHLYKLDNNEFFLNSVNQVLYKKLFTIGGNSINALTLCELLIIISLIKWLAHWSREFSYRWLYANAKDIGVRNSLSIFTQYTSVIVSVLIGLKLLGIDLRGFTVVAAAFAAGIGFGMRDLIVNFFSGILLLIERPFRNGDIISVGNFEGEVILTGMRSMTIRTWDHMEVIVPNADMFTQPFINWTHHDNIIRTVIKLKIHPEDDPHRVQKLILDLLSNHPQVAKEPIPEVFMNEMHESLLEMHVRYYVFLTTERTRAGVRSEVLFAIWDCFKQNNIRVPYPQYDLFINSKNKESPQKNQMNVSEDSDYSKIKV